MITPAKKANHCRRIVLSIGVVASLLFGSANAEEPFKIGGVICNTGPFALTGLDETRGAELAVKEINRAGGIEGRQLEIIIEDDQGKADLGVARATKLIFQDKVSAIIACYGGSVLAFANAARKAEVPIFGLLGTAGLTQGGNPYLFRTALGDPVLLAGLTDIARKRGQKKLAVLYQGDAYGKGALDLIKANAGSLEIVAEESFPVQASLDFTPQLTRIRAKNPDAVVIWTAAAQAIVALKDMEQLGMKVSTYGPPAIATDAVLTGAGVAADGLVVPDVINRDDPGSDQAQFQFYELFKKEYGAYPATFSAMAGWDTVHIVAEALKGSGGKGPEIKANMEKLASYKGASGVYFYSPTNHEGITAASIKWYLVSNGKFTRLKL